MYDSSLPLLQSPIAALDSQPSAALDWSGQEETQQWAFQGHGFELSSLGILLEPQLRCEVVNGLHICPLPCTAPWLIGMSQLRGRVLPVFDLEELFFGTAINRNLSFPTLVIEAQSKSLAMALPSLPRRMKFTEQQVMESQSGVPEIAKPFCRRVFYQDRLWADIDYDSLFLHMRERLIITHYARVGTF